MVNSNEEDVEVFTERNGVASKRVFIGVGILGVTSLLLIVGSFIAFHEYNVRHLNPSYVVHVDYSTPDATLTKSFKKVVPLAGEPLFLPDSSKTGTTQIPMSLIRYTDYVKAHVLGPNRHFANLKETLFFRQQYPYVFERRRLICAPAEPNVVGGNRIYPVISHGNSLGYRNVNGCNWIVMVNKPRVWGRIPTS